MRFNLLLALIAVLILVPFASFVSDGADDLPPSNYYIQGYLADTVGNPLDDVAVTVYDASGRSYVGIYDPNTGLFTVGVNTNSGLTITFEAFGHTAISCPNASKQNEEFLLNLSKATYNSSSRTYTLTGTISDGQYVIMRSSEGTVRGHVSYSSGPVKDATITLTPLIGGNSYTARTDENGNYSLSCPTGSYSLVAERQGFDRSATYQANVTESTNPPINITMEIAELNTYAGLDTAHLLMLIGVIVGIVMAIAAWLLSQRLNGPNRLEIFKEDDDEDDGDSEYF